jgi:glutamyl-tRNA reductase
VSGVLVLLGMNHRSAPLPVREQAGFAEPELASVLPRLASGRPFREALVLSTCNRVELLVRADDAPGAAQALVQFLAEAKGFGSPISRSTATYRGWTPCHLFQVASGLDSLVLGEPQILGQVKRLRDGALPGPRVHRRHALQHCLAPPSGCARPPDHAARRLDLVGGGGAGAADLRRPLGRTVLLGAGKMTGWRPVTWRKQGGEDRGGQPHLHRALQLAESFGGSAVNGTTLCPPWRQRTSW